MRVLRTLTGLLLATLVSLALFGCGGSNGAPTIDPGTAIINDNTKTVIYVPGQTAIPDYVTVDFISTSPSRPSLYSVPLRPLVGGTWELSFADNSLDFYLAPSGNYVGDYHALVYALFPNRDTKVLVGYPTPVTLNIVLGSGGDGPPPPPVWP